MHTSELVYIIPPYLLNTALGAKLQKKLARLDPKLSQLNYLSTSSKFYNDNNREKPDVEQPNDEKCIKKERKFSDDPILNQILKDKLIYKLSTIGLAGDSNPMDRLKQDEDYLFEMYDVYKSKFSHEFNPRPQADIKGSGVSRGSRRRSTRARSRSFDSISARDTGRSSALGANLNSDYDEYVRLIFDDYSRNQDDMDLEFTLMMQGLGDVGAENFDFTDIIVEDDEEDCDLALDQDGDSGADQGGVYFRNYDQSAPYDEGNDLIEQETIDQQDWEGRSTGSKNVYNSDKIGEFKVGNAFEYLRLIIKEKPLSQFNSCKYSWNLYMKFVSSPLKSLLSRIDTEKKIKSSTMPSFVEVNEEFFQYPLPLRWVPLTSKNYTNYLKNDLGLKINIDKGFLNIGFVQKKSVNGESIEEKPFPYPDSYPYKFKDKFTNFIGDKAIPASSGIFYYEVEIKQKCTSSSDFYPIIVTNEEAVSSNNSMSVCLGFTQRFTNVDLSKNPMAAPTSSSSGNNLLEFKKDIDLEVIKNDVDSFINSNSFKSKVVNENEEVVQENSALAEDLENFLSVQPGLFRGSYAVNFEDSLFYNSEKASQSLQRTAVLNMNRRLSLNRQSVEVQGTGKLELGFTLLTYLEKNRGKDDLTSASTENDSNDVCDIYNTEIIGCGINFYDKSIFFTSNGILVKVITEDMLKPASGSTNSGLFYDSESEMARWKFSDDIQISDLKSVYPMIGIKLNTDLKPHKGTSLSSTNTSSTTIKTNLGFKEFKYNINNHIRTFRTRSQNSQYKNLLDRIQSQTSLEPNLAGTETKVSESDVLNIDGKSTLINKLIKGYLNHEGYLESFKTFDNDLQSLAKEVGTEAVGDLVTNSQQENLKLEKSHAANRQIIMNCIKNSDFDLALNNLSVNYPTLLLPTGKENEKGASIEELVRQRRIKASIIFELKLFKYISMIKLHLSKVGFSQTEASSIVTSEIFATIFNYGKELLREYPGEAKKIQMCSSLLFVKDEESLANLPRANNFLNNYEENVNQLANSVNKMILHHLGYKVSSNLERIVDQVDENVKTLGIEYCDPSFMLVNFERDYMDL